MPSLIQQAGWLRRIPLLLLALALGGGASAEPATCSNATLKGTYLYSMSGVLDGKPYAESGREVYDGKGGMLIIFRASDSEGGTETQKGTYRVSGDCILKASYADDWKNTGFVSPDGSSFVYTNFVPGSKNTAISGKEWRVAP